MPSSSNLPYKMKLIINGNEKELECTHVSDLLDKLNLKMDTVAVELNKNIVHRENFDSTELDNDDKLEIVTVVGGG
jgi:sulfur carrier protein